jgi:hypothetical protein
MKIDREIFKIGSIVSFNCNVGLYPADSISFPHFIALPHELALILNVIEHASSVHSFYVLLQRNIRLGWIPFEPNDDYRMKLITR